MSFDVAKCINLHNTIVARAIAQLPKDLKPTVTRNWFTTYNVNISEPGLESEFTDELREFLSGIDIVKPRGRARRIAFTPFLIAISDPSEMMPYIWEMFPGYGQFIRLYKNNGEDPGGLIMYLEEHLVSFLETCEDDPSEVGYVTLESALQRYLNYIDAGKFVVDTSYERGAYGDGGRCEGWRYEGYLPVELDMTLELWDNLVNLIASKMPGSPSTETDESLIPLSILDQYPAIPLFAKAFLSRAKKPPFKMIAPELQVPDEGFIHRIGSILGQRYGPSTDLSQWPPANIILFPWSTSGVPFATPDESDTWVRRRIIDDRAGLYLSPNDMMANEVTMLLPFPVGQNGHVLRSDGTTGERGSHDALYQHGCCDSSLPAHGTSLEAIFSSWFDLVDDNIWAVDENGVTGGEDKWRLADTRDHAERFQAAILCQPPDGDHEDREEWKDEEAAN
jgi:hypothetical protein